MILVLDNYDSFTYNLVHLVAANDQEVRVYRNDALSIGDIEQMRPDGILISPGPGRPEDAGITLELVRALSGRVPILGVCLGHQAIGAALGVDASNLILFSAKTRQGKTEVWSAIEGAVNEAHHDSQ